MLSLAARTRKIMSWPFNAHFAGQEGDFPLLPVFFKVGEFMKDRWLSSALDFDIDQQGFETLKELVVFRGDFIVIAPDNEIDDFDGPGFRNEGGGGQQFFAFLVIDMDDEIGALLFGPAKLPGGVFYLVMTLDHL